MMKDFETIKAAVDNYQSAIDSLTENSSESSLQKALSDRQQIELLLRQEKVVAAGLIEYLTTLDLDLETHRSRILPTENIEELEDWHKIVQASLTETWWQGIEVITPKWWEKLDWFWSILTLIFLTISISLTADAASRFLSGGFDILSALTIAVPSLLALLTSGALTKAGKDARKYLFTLIGIPSNRWEIITVSLSLLLLVGLALFHQSYGCIATQFNQKGVNHYEAHRFDSALSDYQRAIALQPNYAEAHYHLGLLYEDLQKLPEAKTEYQLAIENGSDSPSSLPVLKARNNLGRLHLLEKKYNLAVPPLLGLKHFFAQQQPKASKESQKLKYDLNKNMGWAQLGLSNTTVAQSFLNKAIKLSDQKAASYCLRAQVYEQQNKQTQALQDWRACLSRKSNLQTNPEEYQWKNTAREKLATRRKKL